MLDPWSAAHDVAAGAPRAPRRTASARRRRRGRALGGRGHAGRAAAARSQERDDPLPRARHLPRRRAGPRASAPHRSRRSRDRGLGRAARSPAALPRRRRPARRGRRCRRRHRLAAHVGKPVLRRRAPRATAPTRYPATVRDVVLARVAQLGPQATAVVEATAIAPPSLDAALLLAVCGEAIDAVDECIASGVLHSAGRRRRLPARALARGRRRVTFPCPATRVASLDAAGADATRLVRDADLGAHRASRRGGGRRATPCSGYAPAAAEQAASGRRVPRGSRSVRARTPLRPRPRSRRPRGRSSRDVPGRATSQTTRPRRSTVIREAIRCRQEQGAPLEEARALTELTDYLWCRGYFGEADATVERASQLAAELPERREHAYVFHTRALRAFYFGDADECFEHARRALEIGARFGDAAHRRPCAGHDRQRNGTPRPRARRPPDRGGRPDRTAATASTRSPHEA